MRGRWWQRLRQRAAFSCATARLTLRALLEQVAHVEDVKLAAGTAHAAFGVSQFAPEFHIARQLAVARQAEAVVTRGVFDAVHDVSVRLQRQHKLAKLVFLLLVAPGVNEEWLNVRENSRRRAATISLKNAQHANRFRSTPERMRPRW